MPISITRVGDAHVRMPMALFAPHERQAQINHGQSLKQLAARGGLSAAEGIAILEDRQWHLMLPAVALFELLAALLAFRPRPASMRLWFGPAKESEMAKQTLHADDVGTSAALTFKDKKGNVSQPAAPPVWSLTTDGIVDMTVAPDGLSAQFAVKGIVGTTDVNVVAEGDPTPGVDTLHATGTIEVLPAEATTVDLTFGPVA